MRAKHFQTLTEALKSQKPHEEGALLAQWHTDVETVAKVYDKLFPRFSRTKFLVACGVPIPQGKRRGLRTRVLKELLNKQEELQHEIEELKRVLGAGDERPHHTKELVTSTSTTY